ncbi:hypothetical protein GCM10009719_37640 [Nocardioides kribbensis]
MAAGSGLVLADTLGRGVSPDAYLDRLRTLCVKAGVPTIRLYEVRHTLALVLHRAGEAPTYVAALLGHTLATLRPLRAAHRARRDIGGWASRGGAGNGLLST